MADGVANQLALQQRVTEYACAIDERQWDRLERVFTPDAYIDYRAMGGIDGPYPKVKAWLPIALKDFPGYMHFNGNFRPRVGASSSASRSARSNSACRSG